MRSNFFLARHCLLWLLPVVIPANSTAAQIIWQPAYTTAQCSGVLTITIQGNLPAPLFTVGLEPVPTATSTEAAVGRVTPPVQFSGDVTFEDVSGAFTAQDSCSLKINPNWRIGNRVALHLRGRPGQRVKIMLGGNTWPEMTFGGGGFYRNGKLISPYQRGVIQALEVFVFSDSDEPVPSVSGPSYIPKHQ
jgi:hypothetical protein